MASGGDIPNGGDIPRTGDIPRVGVIGRPPASRLHGADGRFVQNGMGWEWHGLQAVFDMPDKFGDDLLEAQERLMEALAEKVQAYAQENAKWEDRSGEARSRLKAVAIRKGDNFELDLGHGVDYGVYLENANGGAFAIIIPTLREFAPEVNRIGEYFRSSR